MIILVYIGPIFGKFAIRFLVLMTFMKLLKISTNIDLRKN